jgi:hypothetical protein
LMATTSGWIRRMARSFEVPKTFFAIQVNIGS